MTITMSRPRLRRLLRGRHIYMAHLPRPLPRGGRKEDVIHGLILYQMLTLHSRLRRLYRLRFSALSFYDALARCQHALRHAPHMPRQSALTFYNAHRLY